jgi:hypothetical protein
MRKLRFRKDEVIHPRPRSFVISRDWNWGLFNPRSEVQSLTPPHYVPDIPWHIPIFPPIIHLARQWFCLCILIVPINEFSPSFFSQSLSAAKVTCFVKTWVKCSLPNVQAAIYTNSHYRWRLGEWRFQASQAKCSWGPISTNSWVWWHAPDIPAKAGSLNMRMVIQASLRKKIRLALSSK